MATPWQHMGNATHTINIHVPVCFQNMTRHGHGTHIITICKMHIAMMSIIWPVSLFHCTTWHPCMLHLPIDHMFKHIHTYSICGDQVSAIAILPTKMQKSCYDVFLRASVTQYKNNDRKCSSAAQTGWESQQGSLARPWEPLQINMFGEYIHI